jgi:hypothetical protein
LVVFGLWERFLTAITRGIVAGGHSHQPLITTQPGKAGNNKLQTPSTKQIPKYNIQISNKIQRQLFGILNFSHCDLFVICYLSIVIY